MGFNWVHLMDCKFDDDEKYEIGNGSDCGADWDDFFVSDPHNLLKSLPIKVTLINRAALILMMLLSAVLFVSRLSRDIPHFHFTGLSPPASRL